MVAHTLSNLRKWSGPTSKQLPPIESIKSIHVYDFDNTLFGSPQPNPKLWTGPTIGFLQASDLLANGGWWHDARILSATGQGVEIEEPRAWDGWWNERIVELVRMSMASRSVLTVLLTGRSQTNFAGLIERMCRSKGLEFDLTCLKTKFAPVDNRAINNTLQYKTLFFEELIYTYHSAEEIRVYEDRPRHVSAFEEFFEKMARAIDRFSGEGIPRQKPINAKVIQVSEFRPSLDPKVEAREVQYMLNAHNESVDAWTDRFVIKSTVFFTGYLLNANDTRKVLSLLPEEISENEMKFIANNILITPRKASSGILSKVGGLGFTQIWEVTHTGSFEGKIFAAKVVPVPPSAPVYTELHTPHIVLATRDGARPADANRISEWTRLPADKSVLIETTVGEKVQMRIVREGDDEGGGPGPDTGGGVFKKRRSGAGMDERDRERGKRGRGRGKVRGKMGRRIAARSGYRDLDDGYATKGSGSYDAEFPALGY